MDVFSAVVSAIDLAEKVWKTIDNFQKVPERLRRLQFDVKSLQKTLEKLKETEFHGKNDDSSIESEVQEIQKTLSSLQRIISQQHQKYASSMLSRSLRTFRMQLKFDDLNEFSVELQKRKASLSLMINMLVLSSVGKADADKKQVKDSTTVDNEIKARTTAIPANRISRKEFLDSLKAPNYVEDDVRVKAPADGTATWIYDREEYKDWFQGPGSRTLHLVGKMGSGKSVLTKGVVKTLKQMARKTDDQDCMVLYYYCTCVNRVDTATNILKGFLAQLVLDRADVYEEALSGSELLQARKSGETIGWSFEALWQIFTRLVQFSGLTTLYCVVDALDECVDSNSLDELLGLLHQLANGKPLPQMSIKLFFSSREYTHIVHSLDSNADTLRVFVQPEVVVSDIRLAMQNDIASIKRRLKFQDDEVEILQEALLKKAEGMFLWVAMATKSIDENSYDATFETLEELIDDLPTGLKGLYEKNWVKLVESLPTAKFAMANKILTWVLLAEKPLSLSELSMALAIEPGQEKIPPPKKLLRNLSGFILNYLAPFLEVVTSSEVAGKIDGKNASTETLLEPPPPSYTRPPLTYKALDDSKVRLVHQSVQEYLLEACNEKTGPTPMFQINLRKGHEYLARVCLTYLCAEELQLGWIDADNKDKWGLQITTDATRDKMQERLNTHPFLVYAARSWGFHVLKCQHLPNLEDEVENSKSNDVFGAVIRYLKNFRQGQACGTQARQLLMYWDYELHYGPAPPLQVVAGKDLTIVLERLLQEPELDLDERDSEGCTVLHYPTQSEVSVDYPEERLKVIKLLLNAGFDVNACSYRGETPLHNAAAFPLPLVVKMLLNAGADPLIKDKEGCTALNDTAAVASKDVVEALLDAGADVNSVNDAGLTPILYASQAKSWDTIRILADRGAYVDAQNQNGWACLHYVAEHGQTELMRHLLKLGAKSDVKTTSGWTPIHCAVRFDHLDCYKAMIEEGVDVSVADVDQYTVLHVAAEYASLDFVRFLVESKLDVNIKTDQNWTPLDLAAQRGDGPIVEYLLNNKADPMALTGDGYTPLHTACVAGSTEVCKILLPFYEDIDHITYYGRTSLSFACDNPDSDATFIEALIAKGADPNSAHEKNNLMTPLHCAANRGVTHAIEILLRHGADIEREARQRVRPLVFAAKDGHLEAAKLLLKNGADINAGKGDLGRDFTALEMTFFNGHVEVAKWLLDEGADPSIVAFTAIIRNARPQPGHFEILKMILQKIGDLDAFDSYNLSALQCAVLLEKVDLAKSLLDLGANPRKLTDRGDSVIHLASFRDNVEMLKVLTEGWSTDEYSYLLDSMRCTPPQTAAINGSLRALQHFSKTSPAETLRIKNPARIVKSFPVNKNAMAIFEIVFGCGVLDLNVQCDFTDSVLYALCFPTDKLSVDLEEDLGQLIKYGLDVNIVDPGDQSILHRLALSCKPGVAKLLIEHGADLKRRDKAGRSSFDVLAAVAAQRRKSPVIASPPQHSADSIINTQNPPPDFTAFVPTTPEALEKTTKSMDQSASEIDGSLPSSQKPIYTSKSPFETAAEAFTEAADGILLKDDNGGTMLHVAAASGNIELVTAIIDRNATMTADDYGWKPIMVAERGGFADIVTLLSKLESTANGDERSTQNPSRWSPSLRGTELVLSGDDSVAELPTTVDCCNDSVTDARGDKISVVQKAFSVFADAPVPYEAVDYYFEIDVLSDPGGSGALAIGFASLPQRFSYTMPGWPRSSEDGVPGEQRSSWGYHANLGHRTPATGIEYSEPYAEPWTEGDVIGAGYNAKERIVYFMKNGKYQGIAFNDVKGVIYPMVGLAAGGTKVRGRFGVKLPSKRIEAFLGSRKQ